MGVRFPGSGSKVAVNSTIVTTAETVLFTAPLISPPLDNGQVIIVWYVFMIVGTAGTAVTVRIRRGTAITDTLINTGFAAVATAGNDFRTSGCIVDSPGVTGPIQYSVTVQQTAATGNGATSEGCIAAIAL